MSQGLNKNNTKYSRLPQYYIKCTQFYSCYHNLHLQSAPADDVPFGYHKSTHENLPEPPLPASRAGENDLFTRLPQEAGQEGHSRGTLQPTLIP